MGFVLGGYFVTTKSQDGASDPEEVEEGLEVTAELLLGEGRMYYAS